MVSYLIKSGQVSVELPLADGKITPLLLASSLNQPGMCQHLITMGANKEAMDAEGDGPLHRAIRTGARA